MISQDRLHALFIYEPETGVFIRRVTLCGRAVEGSIAGTLKTDGYVVITVDGYRYPAHRLAWFYMTGAWPKADTDHINGLRSDNRFSNLREATRSENQQNQKRARSNNKLGVLGVRQHSCGRFEASIKTTGRWCSLGLFASADEASGAYLVAKAKQHPFQTLVA